MNRSTQSHRQGFRINFIRWSTWPRRAANLVCGCGLAVVGGAGYIDLALAMVSLLVFMAIAIPGVLLARQGGRRNGATPLRTRPCPPTRPRNLPKPSAAGCGAASPP